MSKNKSSAWTIAELNQDLWESGLLYLCRTNSEGEILLCSRGFTNLTSYQPSVSPSSLASWLHPEDRSVFLSDLKRVTTGGGVMERRMVRLMLPDGRVLLMEVLGEPWTMNGEIRGATLAWWDKSDEEATISWKGQDEMDTFREGIKNFISSLFDPVVLLNTEGRIIHVNHAVLELLGYRKAELIGHPVAFLFESSPDKIQKAMLRFAKLMRSGQMRDVNTQWVTREQETIPVTLSGSVIRSNTGELVGMVLVGRDERKNALLTALEKKNQELSQAYEELKRLDQLKDDVMSLVGHELRAPLANILGYAEFLNDWQLSPEERREFTRIIYQESQHLRRLVNDILDLSRMEAGRMVYNYVRDSINRVIQAAVDSLRVDLEKKLIKLELKLDDQLEPLEFDPDRIQQVVTNLIHNAIKFSSTGNTITITSEAVEGGVRVSVADQGVGIEPEHATRIFNKFEQIIDIHHHHEGAGLGLPIAKKIIEEGHQGQLWFESKGKDQGTVFKFILPERRSEV